MTVLALVEDHRHMAQALYEMIVPLRHHHLALVETGHHQMAQFEYVAS